MRRMTPSYGRFPIDEPPAAGRMMHATMGRPRDPSADGRLLEATRALLHDVGYRQLTMEAVALRAGVGKPTLYRRWHSKAELVFELLRSEVLPIQVPDTGSLEQDLVLVATGLRDACALLDRAIFADQLAMMILDAEFSRAVREQRLDVDLERVQVVWDRALLRGEVDPSLDGREVLRDLATLVLMRILQGHEAFDDEQVRLLVHRTVEGVRPRRRRRKVTAQ